MSEDTRHHSWVDQRLACLPSSPPSADTDAALVYYRNYEERAKRCRRVQRALVFSIAVVAVFIVAEAASHAIARSILDRFYMRRPEAVRANDAAIGTSAAFHIESTISPHPSRFVFDTGKASEQAGFEPRLPATLKDQLASGLAVLKLSEPTNVRIQLHVEDWIAAFRSQGLTDVRVPPAWDGAEIGYQVGPGILVVFLNGSLRQSLPPSIVTPAGFPIIDFTELVLRGAGLDRKEAHNARNIFVDTGGAFAIVPVGAKSVFHQINLTSGPALLFENDSDDDERQKCSMCPGPHELVLTWVATDRIYQLRSQTMTLAQTVALADAVN